MVRGCCGCAAACSAGSAAAGVFSATVFPFLGLDLEAKGRYHVDGRDAPFLGRSALRDRAQLAREDLAPEDDGRVGAAQALVVAVGDATLASLHGDVLHDGEVRMLDIDQAAPSR